MRKLFAVLIVILFFSCGKKRSVPDGILEPEKMQAVFWDYMRADVFSKDFIKKDLTKNDTIENIKLQEKIFGYYNISKEDFYRSYNYYTAHPELMGRIIDSMLAKQNKRNAQLLHSQKNGVTIKTNHDKE